MCVRERDFPPLLPRLALVVVVVGGRGGGVPTKLSISLIPSFNLSRQCEREE